MKRFDFVYKSVCGMEGTFPVHANSILVATTKVGDFLNELAKENQTLIRYHYSNAERPKINETNDYYAS